LTDASEQSGAAPLAMEIAVEVERALRKASDDRERKVILGWMCELFEYQPTNARKRAWGQPLDEEVADTAEDEEDDAIGSGEAEYLQQHAELSDNEFAAHVAFYWQHRAEGDAAKSWIDAKDLIAACRAISRKIPSHPNMALTHSKNGGLLRVGKAGEFQLTTDGENFVRTGTRPKKAVKKAPKKAKRAAK